MKTVAQPADIPVPPMHRQTHIYVGTLSRRERRWNGRQRTALRLLAVRTAAALGAALAVMAALPGVGN